MKKNNWLLLFKVCSYIYRECSSTVLDKYFSQSSDLMAVLGLCKKNEFSVAKYRLAKVNKLPLIAQRRYDFYGDVYTNFVSHLSEFVKHKVVSACAIKQRPAQNLYVEEKTIPSVLVKSRECFIQFLNDWLFSSWSASWKRSLSEPVTDGEHIYWEYNNEQ